jgi:hypothetical protein
MAAAAHSKKQTRHELQLMSWEQTAKNSRTNQHATTCSSPRDYAKLGTTVKDLCHQGQPQGHPTYRTTFPFNGQAVTTGDQCRKNHLSPWLKRNRNVEKVENVAPCLVSKAQVQTPR